MFTNHFGIHRVLDMLDMLGCRKELSQGLCAMQMCHSPKGLGAAAKVPKGVRPAVAENAENRT